MVLEGHLNSSWTLHWLVLGPPSQWMLWSGLHAPQEWGVAASPEPPALMAASPVVPSRVVAEVSIPEVLPLTSALPAVVAVLLCTVHLHNKLFLNLESLASCIVDLFLPVSCLISLLFLFIGSMLIVAPGISCYIVFPVYLSSCFICWVSVVVASFLRLWITCFVFVLSY